MRIIRLDGSKWSERSHFWQALRDALAVVPEHGTNFPAFEDSVFYHPHMLGVRPPFTVVVEQPAPITRPDVEIMAEGWARQREWKMQNYGEDVEAVLVVSS